MLHAAAGVLLVLGLLHSILGEILLFRRLGRVTGFEPLGFPPILGAPMLPHATLRATWHTPTLLALAIASILARLGSHALTPEDSISVRTLAASLVACALAWLVLSRGKHLGWTGFLTAAVLTWLGS